MAFTQKLIQVTFTSGSNSFQPIQISGLRTFCHVVAAGNFTMAECDLVIYGMTLSDMNQLSTLGWKIDQSGGGKPNADKIDVYAGDENGMSHVYQGGIYAAYSDFQGGPNIPFHVVAMMGSAQAGMMTKPISINNKSADVAGIMSQIAQNAGLQFENNGVNIKIAYPYLPGTPKDQAFQLAKHAGINIALDRGTLAIWPQSGNRQQSATVTPTTGLVGYPAWSSEGVRLKMLYNPDLYMGGQLIVQGSAITPANNTWTITRLEHNLQALTPNGEWFSNVQGSTAKPGQTGPSLPSNT